MPKRSPKSVSEKLEIVLLYLETGESLSWLTRNQGISKDTLSNWVRKYKEAGVEGLEESLRRTVLTASSTVVEKVWKVSLI